MKGILLSLVACLATHAVAIPCCLPTGDLETVVYFAHPTDCSLYLACQAGILTELSCPHDTFWNDDVKACTPQTDPTPEEPTTTAAEPGTPSSTTAAPTSQPTSSEPVTTTSAPTGDCPAVYDSKHQVYFPHVDCTKYYICTYEGNKLEQSCPLNLHWNQKLSYCDYPEQAGCSTISTVSPPATDGDCPAVYDPSHQVYFPHAECTKYYICTYEGNKLEQNCPLNLHWNQHRSYCDFPEQAGCSTVTTVSPPAPNGDCPAVYDPSHQVYFPHADCTKYYICTYEGKTLEQACPSGLHWNQGHSYCDYPELAQCTSP